MVPTVAIDLLRPLTVSVTVTPPTLTVPLPEKFPCLSPTAAEKLLAGTCGELGNLRLRGPLRASSKNRSQPRQTQSEHHPLIRISAPVSIAKTQRRGSLVEVSLMKSMFVTTLFMLASLAWAVAQQPGTGTQRSSGQDAAPRSQVPGANQTQPTTPGGSDQAGSQGQASNEPVTEGCLGGSDPNFTLTDRANTIYKLNLAPNADTSKLRQHVGES